MAGFRPEKLDKNGNKIKLPLSERIFDFCNVTFFVLLSAIMLLPFWNVFAISLTGNAEYMREAFILFPKEPTMEAYNYLFSTPLIPRAYLVTFTITIAGTFLSTLVTSMLAFGMTKSSLRGYKYIMIYLLITMFFSGGTIPLYMALRTYGLLNTRAVLVISGCLSVYNIIIARTFFANSIPGELIEAAEIDGATALQCFIRVVLPISMTVIAVIGLYSAVGYWNAYKPGLMYIRSQELQPLQVVLRELLMVNNVEIIAVDESMEELLRRQEQIRYGIIVVSTLPIMLLYPCLQRFFAKGVMIGAVKG